METSRPRTMSSAGEASYVRALQHRCFRCGKPRASSRLLPNHDGMPLFLLRFCRPLALSLYSCTSLYVFPGWCQVQQVLVDDVLFHPPTAWAEHAALLIVQSRGETMTYLVCAACVGPLVTGTALAVVVDQGTRNGLSLFDDKAA